VKAGLMQPSLCNVSLGSGLQEVLVEPNILLDGDLHFRTLLSTLYYLPLSDFSLAVKGSPRST
jgi:hypothetical protein